MIVEKFDAASDLTASDKMTRMWEPSEAEARLGETDGIMRDNLVGL